MDDHNALCWKVCCSWVLPDIIQASRFSLLARGCGLLFAGFWRRVLLEHLFSENKNSFWECLLLTSSGVYTVSVGQLGTTMIPEATSKTILCNTFPVTTKGENTILMPYAVVVLSDNNLTCASDTPTNIFRENFTVRSSLAAYIDRSIYLYFVRIASGCVLISL